MADLLSYVVNNSHALSSGLATMFSDEMVPANRSEWSCPPERIRKQIPWYRRREARSRSGEYRWRETTERWVAAEIARGTLAGAYLDARRRRVLAALGMTFEEALQKLTFEPHRSDA